MIVRNWWAVKRVLRFWLNGGPSGKGVPNGGLTLGFYLTGALAHHRLQFTPESDSTPVSAWPSRLTPVSDYHNRILSAVARLAPVKPDGREYTFKPARRTTLPYYSSINIRTSMRHSNVEGSVSTFVQQGKHIRPGREAFSRQAREAHSSSKGSTFVLEGKHIRSAAATAGPELCRRQGGLDGGRGEVKVQVLDEDGTEHCEGILLGW
ncbi:unnamed protein product [Calypogeia fissa]